MSSGRKRADELIREFGLLDVRLAAALGDECVGEKVKGRAQVVHAVPDDCAPLSWDRLALHEVVSFLLGMRIVLDVDAVRVSCIKDADSRVKLRKMFFGPVNLDADTEKEIGHGETSTTLLGGHGVPQIEVTRKMIDAGVVELEEFRSEYIGAHETARRVFLAMSAAKDRGRSRTSPTCDEPSQDQQ